MKIANILATPRPLDDSPAEPPPPAPEVDENEEEDRWAHMPCTD